MSILLLDDGITIRNANAIHTRLKEASELDCDVIIDVDYTQDIDICGLQIIESARKSFLEAGHCLVLSRPADQWAGIIEGAGLVGDRHEDAAFWFHRGSTQ